MRNQLDNLEEAEMSFEEIVSTTIYLDDLAELHAFDEVYAQYFGSPLPARTVVQQIAPVKRAAGQSTDKKDDTYPDFEQVSLIAVRKSFHQ
jgi:enamine deaminase RidA (YjgF/YER057c/UK114 family)